jgi:glycosyltransferase involved in cell wall biosynthesis
MENPRLVISHESGDEGDLYGHRIFEYASRLGVEVLSIGDSIGQAHCFSSSTDKKYTMDDVYLAADVVTYPSRYEGFGNAFLESVYFKKPIVVNRYAIYVEDIEPCGFEVIGFESFLTRQVIEHLKAFLEPEALSAAMEKNYELGKDFFSYKVLENKLLPLIHSFI